MTVWQPGMRCVLVEEMENLDGGGKPGVVVGRVYEVTGVAVSRGYVCLMLAGFDTRDKFEAAAFRPLSETRLDQFRVHLAPNPKKQVAA